MRLSKFMKKNGLSRVDLVKLDIEGGEEYLVRDLAGTIVKYQPSLAVGIYHKQTHFIDLAQQLMSMCEGYYFYFNIYSWKRFEGILYCILRERIPCRSSPSP